LKVVKSPKSPPPPLLPRLLTVPEAAEALSVSERTVWRWIKAHEIECYRLGYAVRIAEDELIRFLEKRRCH
jgi:excisionase family DNA binding protein